MVIKNLILFLLLIPLLGYSKLTLPELDTPIIDSAHVLDEWEENDILTELLKIEHQNKIQITLLTIPTAEPENLVSYTDRALDEVEYFQNSPERSILIVIDVTDFKAEIRQGEDLKGLLTDEYCEEIAEKILPPAFVQNRFHIGIWNLLLAIDEPLRIETETIIEEKEQAELEVQHLLQEKLRKEEKEERERLSMKALVITLIIFFSPFFRLSNRMIVRVGAAIVTSISLIILTNPIITIILSVIVWAILLKDPTSGPSNDHRYYQGGYRGGGFEGIYTSGKGGSGPGSASGKW